MNSIYLLELWELILIIGVIFCVGFAMGMYVTTQIEHWINKKTK